MKKPRKRNQRTANDAALVEYQQVRDRFLARIPERDSEQLEHYVAIGYFVLDRWMAEELDRVPGQPLDEQACWDRWDQCSEKHIRDMRTEAKELVEREVSRRRVRSLLGDWGRKAEPVRGFASVLSWTGMEMLRGFVGAIGLLLFGLLFVWLAPSVVKSVRGAIDDSLPAETRPTDGNTSGGNSTEAASPEGGNPDT